MTKHEVSYGQHKIKFSLKRKDVKNMNLSLKPNLKIEVSANRDVPVEAIHKFVKKKASWIIKNREYFKKTLAEIQNEKEYTNGESFKYLGKQYRLKIIKSDEEKVKCIRGFLNIHTNKITDYERKKKLLNKWYSERSDSIFNEVLETSEETNRLLRMSRYLNTLHVCLLSNSFKLDILVDVFMKVLGRAIGTHLSEERDEQRDDTSEDV